MINSTSLIDASGTSDYENAQNGHADVSIESSTSSSIYTKYEDLADLFPSQMSIEQMIDELMSKHASFKNDWKKQFETLECLRILNKYHYTELNPKILGFTDFIVSCIDSLRSNLNKEALLLLQELLPNSRSIPLPYTFIDKIVPILCEKSISEKGFIRLEARKVVKELELFCAGDASVIALVAKSFDKNVTICEFAFQALCQSIKNLGDDLQFKLTFGGCKVLFRAILKALDGKRAIMKKQSEEMWIQLRNMLQKECELESFLADKVGLTNQEVTLLMQINLEKKPVARVNLHKFIKEQKMLIEKDPNVDKMQEELPLNSKIYTDNQKAGFNGFGVLPISKENFMQ